MGIWPAKMKKATSAKTADIAPPDHLPNRQNGR